MSQVLGVLELTRLGGEIADVIRGSGLRGDSLDAFVPPAGVQSFEADEAQMLLNEWVKSVDPHNFVLLRDAYAEAKAGGGREPDEMPSWSMDGRLWVLHLPGLGALEADSVGAVTYAERVAEGIAAAGPVASGWVVDLRSNDGGNMHPMLAGLAGILGYGRLCGFLGPDGVDTTWVTCDAEAVRVGGEATAHVPPHDLVKPSRLAIAAGPSTLSSGEWVALALRGRTGARRFGLPTGGLLTAVSLVEVTGGAVGVTCASAVDAEGHRQQHPPR